MPACHLFGFGDEVPTPTRCMLTPNWTSDYWAGSRFFDPRKSGCWQTILAEEALSLSRTQHITSAIIGVSHSFVPRLRCVPTLVETKIIVSTT